MLKDIQFLMDEIEAQRKELIECGEDLNNPEMLDKSRKLDELINRYYELTGSNCVLKKAAL
jgi:hypothetical protein